MPGVVKKTIKERTMIRSVIFGVFAAMVICVLGVGVVSFLVYSGKIKEISLDLIAAVVVLLVTFVGGMVSARVRRKEAAVISGITATTVAAVFAVVNIIFFDAVFFGVWLKALGVILGWMAASLVSVRKKSKR